MATRADGSAIRKTLRAIAMKLPDVEVGVACKGTALESTTYNVRKKAFLFVGPKEARLKRASGWVKFDLATPPPKRELTSWITESHGLMSTRKKA